MFDMLCDLHFGNTHEYVYEMVATPSALADAVERLGWNDDISTIYIAAHGSEEGLHLHGGLEGKIVSRTKLANMLVNAGSTRRKLSGIYLGACDFGTQKLAEFLLKRDRSLRWVAGYRNPADFFDGTAIDVMFFNWWLDHLSDEPASRPKDTVTVVADKLRKNCRGLINTPEENGYDRDDEWAPGMGLSIYVRCAGPNHRVIDILRENE